MMIMILCCIRFWSGAPHLETSNPVFLKSALHINCANLALTGDDGLVPQSSSGRVHSLDSNYTTDVLRYDYNICLCQYVSIQSVSDLFWRATTLSHGWSWILALTTEAPVFPFMSRRSLSSTTPWLLLCNNLSLALVSTIQQTNEILSSAM